jgi:uncharacterized protein (TIGR02452 family)
MVSQLLGAARLRSPFNFYTQVNTLVESGAISPKTAYYVLRAYDKSKNLSTNVTDRIAELAQTGQLTFVEAYNVMQTYRMVRNDEALYNAALPKIYPNPRDQTRVENLKAYRSVRLASNGPFRVESERLRQEIGKGDTSNVTSTPRFKGQTPVEVWGATTFVSAQRLVQEGLNPAVLNMANEREPGGGFVTGAMAQEEHLCRQSNLYEGLEFARNKGEYPIGEFDVLVVPKTTFFRDDTFQNLQRPFRVDVMTSAAYICDTRKDYNRPQDESEYRENTKLKMRSMFRAAIHNGNDSLLLSAFGCGAFKNDPRVISQLYKEVLAEPEFQGQFKKVVFGIINDRNGSNLRPFQETFR